MSSQQRAKVPQHPVAGLVAPGIVELLEVVDVDHHHTHRLLIAAGAAQLSLQRFFQVAPVEQPGQRVPDGLLA